MKVLAIANRKGGCAKTTSAVNLAAIFAELGKRVLLIDLDSQGHASEHIGMRVDVDSPVYRVLARSENVVDLARACPFGFDVLAGGKDIAAAELFMKTSTSGNGRMVLREALEDVPSGRWDVVLLDCPPALDQLTMAALIACDGVLVPLPLEPLPFDGLKRLLESIEGVRRYDNRALTVQAVFVTLCNERTILASTIREEVEQLIPGNPLFAPAAMLNSRVRRNIALAEASKAARPVTAYNPACHGADDYRELAGELVARGVA
ncbi:MAG: hypothetical protein RLZZ450_3091 [Pseudomonadota bacterium]|jgi:chromosome partitioning protein